MICKIEYTRINAKRYHNKKKKRKKEGLFGKECYILYDKRGGGTFTTSFANPPKMSHVP